MIAPSIYWVNKIGLAKIALAPRPRGGVELDEEMLAWRAAGVDLVVSLLESAEIRELDLIAQAVCCEQSHIRFIGFPIPDRGVPAHRENFNSLIQSLAFEIEAGTSMLIHCRAGIGRTGLVACCVLKTLGMTADDAFGLLTQARGVSVPDTPEQRKYAEEFRPLLQKGSS